MSHASLREFISSVLARKRVRFGDLRRRQRDVLPTEITSREEAEALPGLSPRMGVAIAREVVPEAEAANAALVAFAEVAGLFMTETRM
jgi:hypothetical protein